MLAPPAPLLSSSHLSRWTIYGLPLFVCLALCLPKLWQGGWSTDTPWYAAIALDAYQSREFWTLPGIDDQPYFNKPPLAFWLNGLPLAAFGASVFAARLGSVAACMICVGLATHAARRGSGNDHIGLWTGIILTLTWEFVRHARSFSLDLWLVAFLLLGLVGVFEAVRRGRGVWLLLLGVGVGLSLMTKPMIGLVAFPIVAMWLVLERNARWLPWLIPSVLLAVALAAPWHISMWLRHGEAFTGQYFGREIADRAAGGGTNLNKQAEAWYFYLALIGKAYWPWLVTTVLSLAAVFARSTPASAKSMLRLILLWTAVWLISLTLFADKRPRYALVLYPVWAWASAIWLVQLAPLVIKSISTRFLLVTPIAAAVLLVALSLAPIRMHREDPPQWPALYAKINELNDHGKAPKELYCGALVGQRAARLYLEFNRWPIPITNDAGEQVHTPEAGALLIYHRRDGRSPGANETVIWQRDDLTLTTLDSIPWKPVKTADPGE